ncbi:hypothetical protein BH24ACT23_BH24ACT23_05750 [soil metagenome]
MHPVTAAAVAERWQRLPDTAKTSAQLLGRRTPGCEGTHGVFPRCNLACTPCYHAQAAQRVRTDGEHTVREVERQMTYLQSRRGPGQHAQLIGGEVSLLGPREHARALSAMERHGRKPMSMSHGDFDYEYLESLAVDEDGRPRFRRLRFAGHFDSLMLGRRSAPRPRSEADLDPERRRFVAMFKRLRSEHGIRFDLAHNMTVTPRNLGQVSAVVSTCRNLEFGMLSFQPAAYVGNPSRWKEDFAEVTIDSVWSELERGMDTRLPWRHLQMGDTRCNRSAYGALVHERWVPFLDDRDSRDLRVRDLFLEHFGPMDFDRPLLATAVAVARVVARRPALALIAVGWAARFARRAGVRRLLGGRPRSLTLVVHAFMDADVVKPAWAAIRRGETAKEPRVRAAQERLQACSYEMAHPDDDMLVPACVQHSVLDPGENVALERLLAVKR